MRYSDAIRSEQELEELLSTPSPALIEMMKRLDGDLMTCEPARAAVRDFLRDW